MRVRASPKQGRFGNFFWRTHGQTGSKGQAFNTNLGEEVVRCGRIRFPCRGAWRLSGTGRVTPSRYGPSTGQEDRPPSLQSGAQTTISTSLPNVGEARKPAIGTILPKRGVCEKVRRHASSSPCNMAAAQTRAATPAGASPFAAGNTGNGGTQFSRNMGHRVGGASACEAVAGSELNAFDRILASLHEAALDPARWPGASALIDKVLRIHGSTLACGDGEVEGDYRLYFMWVCHLGQRRRDLERLYLETYYPVDEAIPRVRLLPYNRLFHITDLYTEEERKSSEAYNALRTLAHAGHGIDVRLEGLNGSRIMWQVDDPVDGDGWSPAQLDWIRRLLPHIRQTVHVQQTLAHANALGATLTEMLDHAGLGIVQLDTRGRIVAANDRARDVLRSGDGLFDRDGFLSARAARDNDGLQALLSRALPPSGAQGTGGSTIVRRPGGLRPLVLHVNPVGRWKADFPAWWVAALVLVVDPAREAPIDPGVAAEALDLTGMESRVAVLLAQGMSVSQIATATGRKESTIRSHVKRMFAKHGFSRQAELVRLVRSLAGAPGTRG